MTIELLIERAEYGLAKEGLKISEHGKSEMVKRWNKKEAEGGYAQDIRDSEWVNNETRTPMQIWRDVSEARLIEMKKEMEK